MAYRGRPLVEAHHAEFPFGRANIRRRRIDVRNMADGSEQLNETLATGETSIDVKRRAADHMLAAKLGNGQPALRLAQHAYDLDFGETALLHRNLLVHLAEKIRPSHPLNHG